MAATPAERSSFAWLIKCHCHSSAVNWTPDFVFQPQDMHGAVCLEKCDGHLALIMPRLAQAKTCNGAEASPSARLLTDNSSAERKSKHHQISDPWFNQNSFSKPLCGPHYASRCEYHPCSLARSVGAESGSQPPGQAPVTRAMSQISAIECNGFYRLDRAATLQWRVNVRQPVCLGSLGRRMQPSPSIILR
ncbi:hypothetical protein ACCO45_010343 [Purpureocillium lilacinum]|uniref:Uncharacterized protein n=1 Tax=Purpureocillium lilacinum TaxID=33203 RepID=A0ACC4DEI2_PURLI